jgi:DNA-binding NarL/FixJ family response regulator
MVSVVVVEDHASLREALVHALSDTAGIEVVGSCEDGAAAVDLVLHVRPDVVVMDLRLPTMDGAEATTRILEIWPHARILIHTSAAGSARAKAATVNGAVATVGKAMSLEPLIQAIRHVHAGRAANPGSTPARHGSRPAAR